MHYNALTPIVSQNLPFIPTMGTLYGSAPYMEVIRNIIHKVLVVFLMERAGSVLMIMSHVFNVDVYGEKTT